MIATALFIALGIYLVCGLAFAIPFVFTGVKKIDPHATHGSWGFRVLIFPGTMALWPLLLRRWASGVHEPPEECNAHRVFVGRVTPCAPNTPHTETARTARRALARSRNPKSP